MTAIESMSTTWLWAHIFAIAVATYALRISFIGFFSYYEMPAGIKEHMYLVPPAVLAALALPPLFYRDGGYQLSIGNPFIVAGLVAALVAWWTESLVGTIASGFVTYFVVASIMVF